MPFLQCPVEGCDWKSQELGSAFAAALTAALQMHGQTAHPPQAQQATHKLKLDPPTISAGSNPDQWSSFKRQWNMYKTGVNISANMLATALFYCCDQDLRTDVLRDTRTDIANMHEPDLLETIHRLAVKEESTLVHRIKLGKMAQAPGTGIRTFLASLRGQASLCNYIAACKEAGCQHTFDFSDEIIKDNLIRGIADPEILSDLLGDPKTNRTLDETVAFIAQKEQGKLTQNAVGNSVGATHNQDLKYSKTNSSTCWACGGPSHGPRNDRATRSRKCEAWTFTCAKCEVKGHYTASCSKCTACGSWGHRDTTSRACPKKGGRQPNNKKRVNDNNAATQDRTSYVCDNTVCDDNDSPSYVFDQLCVTTQHGPRPTNTTNTTNSFKQTDKRPYTNPVSHHIFNGQWLPRPSKPHPTILVRMTPIPEDHAIFGHPIPMQSSYKGQNILMVTDTGCQSSIIPLQTAQALGYSKAELLPVTLAMRGAIREDLCVLGGIIVGLAIKEMNGAIRTTRIMCYVSDTIEKAFLCREALADLGIIPYDFPISKARDSLAAMDEIICSCPKRSKEPPPLPQSLPPGLSATENNVEALKDWLLNYYASTAFNVCEHQPLPLMNCEPLKLHVDPNAQPVATHKPALVPIHWQDKVYADLERDVRIGVLERVNPNTPTTWCSRMVITSKSDGTPRRTVDLQPLNRHSVRQTHHVPSPFHLANRVPQGMRKTVTDAWNGYHSVPICEEDRHITTFITPWGRYRYKVAPQGFLASGDAYNQRFDSLITDFANKVKCVDDTCMWEESITKAFFQTCTWLDLCARNGITLNPKKFQFAQETVEFAGLSITPTNIQPSAKFIDAIRNFPTPTDITGARAWFGLINQGAYAFSMAHQMKPFRTLLKPSTKFVWTNDLDVLFQKSKDVIINEMKEGVRLFDPARPTCLATDWSVDGVGFFLMQKYCRCSAKTPICCVDGWKLCLVGSRFTHPAESRYAPIEGEALAVVYALHQTRYYVLGCKDLIIATDHKPLVPVLGDRSLTSIDNRRLLNLKEKTLAYRFTIVHVPGKKNTGPDAVSRHPSGKADRLRLPGEPPESDTLILQTLPRHNTVAALYQRTLDTDTADDTSTQAAAMTALVATDSVVTWDMVREATTSDKTFLDLIRHIEAGFPAEVRELPAELRPFHRHNNSLCVLDGVILMGQRIVIPPSLRETILAALHAAHQGVSAMLARAMDSVYWPNITVDIAKTRDKCVHCHKMAKSNPMQPPTEIKTPDYPFQLICCDYFTFHNTDYVVVVDRYSHWPMVFRSEGADGLIKRLRETFVTFGIPEEVTTDGGPQFTAIKTTKFLQDWGVKHRLTSVANPHANCRAELAVKTVKRMLVDNVSPTGSLDVDKFQRAMLMYRNSIDPETKASPALILFGRPIRDAIPIPLGRYSPHETWSELRSHRELALARRHSREHERWSEHTHRLPALKVGDHVYIQNLMGNHPRRWERTGVVTEVRQHHQYVIRVDGSGRVTLRNRQHLRKFTPFITTPHARNPDAFINPHSPNSPSEPTQHVSPDPHSTYNPRDTVHPLPSPHPRDTASPALQHAPGVSANGQEPAEDQTTPSSLETDNNQSNPQRLPRALARLQPHNNPGIREQTP